MKIKKNNYDNDIKRPFRGNTFAKPTENPNGKSSNQFMEIKSYHGPRDFFAIFLLALEPQGGSRDDIKPFFLCAESLFNPNVRDQ